MHLTTHQEHGVPAGALMIETPATWQRRCLAMSRHTLDPGADAVAAAAAAANNVQGAQQGHCSSAGEPCAAAAATIQGLI